MLSVGLQGCFGSKELVIKEDEVPILYCPAPTEIKRPELPIHEMTDEQKASPGEVAKYYKATVKILIGYVKELESQLNQYKEISQSYKELRKQLEQKLNQPKNKK